MRIASIPIPPGEEMNVARRSIRNLELMIADVKMRLGRIEEELALGPAPEGDSRALLLHNEQITMRELLSSMESGLELSNRLIELHSSNSVAEEGVSE